MSRGGHFHVAGLRKRFGRRLLLDDVELHLHETSCTLLTGENGAGKSTLLRILAGLEKPDGGSFRLGRRLYPSWRKARRSLQKAVMYLHQQPYLFDGSVEYNLRLALGGQREGQEALIRTALQWIDMESFRETPARTLSGGERQRLALARAWLASPEIMLLDEPTANLDTESRGRTLELLRGLRNQGIVRCPPWRAKRRRVVPGSREATRDTRRAEGAKGDPKGASERGVQSYGRPVCSRNELAMLWRNAG